MTEICDSSSMMSEEDQIHSTSITHNGDNTSSGGVYSPPNPSTHFPYLLRNAQHYELDEGFENWFLFMKLSDVNNNACDSEPMDEEFFELMMKCRTNIYSRRRAWEKQIQQQLIARDKASMKGLLQENKELESFKGLMEGSSIKTIYEVMLDQELQFKNAPTEKLLNKFKEKDSFSSQSKSSMESHGLSDSIEERPTLPPFSSLLKDVSSNEKSIFEKEDEQSPFYKNPPSSFLESDNEPKPKSVKKQLPSKVLNKEKGADVTAYIFDVPKDNPAPAKKAKRTPSRKKERSEKNIEHDRAVLWGQIVKKQIPKAHKSYIQVVSAHMNNSKKYAHLAAREVRRCYFKISRSSKDFPLRAKKWMREMLTFWKKNEREEKELRKKAEKAEQEKKKAEEEAREARRQARKLNFLISQTELYTHFIANKTEESLKSLDDSKKTAIEDLSMRGLIYEDEYADLLETKAKQQAFDAFNKHMQKTRDFDAEVKRNREDKPLIEEMDQSGMNFLNPSSMPSDSQITQPVMLHCSLKSYQLKGLNWLANLYEQGINGILADEMGLGKTVQSISLMAHLAESQNIWGPFLVIAPASTLHNWQQEFSKFTPDLKALPYWGSVTDRKVLRRFWNTKKLSTKEAPFHVLITSYQLVVTDEKYFQKIKWQYMVLDEAQAIKSSSSVRWKTLLGFNCRNRLLLTGTPIQNSMQELWALLHFIMPTLFDSHNEFSEWFSKDIESHAEHKSGLNEHQLSRLHMILKPFMLRRIKKDVENELGDKIEIEIPCELSAKQKKLYILVQRKLKSEEFLGKIEKLKDDEYSTASLENLMNLVMQFRKICNHPELLEKSEVQSPFYFSIPVHLTPAISSSSSSSDIDYYWSSPAHHPIQVALPKLLLDFVNESDKNKFIHRTFNLFHPYYIHQSRYRSSSVWSSISPLTDASPQELSTMPHLFLFSHFLEKSNQHRHQYYQEQKVWDYMVKVRIWHTLFGRHLMKLNKLVKWLSEYDYLSRLKMLYLPKIISSLADVYCSDSCFDSIHMRPLKSPLLLKQSLETDLLKMVSSRRVLERFVLHRPLYEREKTYIWMPSARSLINDSGKMLALDSLLDNLKREGHRVLIYFQMTKMIDLMEDYLHLKQYKYLRLDGSSKISDRRDMVADWQSKEDIFVFLLSTRAGGLGINLTAADTVIFYDSDWNPTVDQQAMDRAHRLGQTKQVVVYRLITKGTIEERIQQRALQKHEIQKVVISGGEFRQMEGMRSKEIVSLLLDEDANFDFDSSIAETRGFAPKRKIKSTFIGEKKLKLIPE